MFAASLFRGSAEVWFEPTLTDYFNNEDQKDREPETKAIFASYGIFEDRFKRNFADVDEERTATVEIQTLKQTGSAVSYSNKFRCLAARLDWGDTALAQMYYNGLKEAVKDLIINPPKGLQKMID